MPMQTPAVPLPTDNIYKFVCLFGLTLVVAGIVAGIAAYATSLDKKTQLLAEIIELESIDKPSALEEKRLALKRRILEVVRSNERLFVWCTAALIGIGGLCVAGGGTKWYRDIQMRDDKVADLQLRKLALEVAALEEAASGRKQAIDPTDAG